MTAADALPVLVRGARRGYFLRLLGTGLAQAGLALVTVLVVPVVLGAQSRAVELWALLALAAGAVVLGLVRARERVLAERLGQHYVQEIRTGLVASGLAGAGRSGAAPSLGITVARTTNDLTSVRNWVALGVAPLAVAVPVLVGVLGALALVDPLLVAAVATPVAGFGLVVLVVAPRVQARARELRRKRGVLASHVADTVMAAPGILAAGGTDRELRGVRRRGRQVQEAAVARAGASGVLRGSAAAAGALATVAVLAVAGPGALTAAQVATALTVVGILVGPVADLALVVEYRQSFLAARRILGPALVAGRLAAQDDRGRRAGEGAEAHPAAVPEAEGLRVRGLVVDGVRVPDVDVSPSGRLVLQSSVAARGRAVAETLAGVRRPDAGLVMLDGQDLAALDHRARRGLVGAAFVGWPLERGTIARSVRYRVPDSDLPLGPTLEMVGLAGSVAALPSAERTVLRRGGEPLGRADRARVQLARAVHGEPAMVVIDHLDDEVDREGRRAMGDCLRAQPGVVVVATEWPEMLMPEHQVWDLDADDHQSG